MTELARNVCEPADLSDADVEAAIGRIAARDVGAGREARDVFGSMTWGEGPGAIRLAGLHNWLWFVVPTKYLTDEAGYMTGLASAAAELFDELGLHAYAAECRSEVTVGVHAAFARSDSEGRAALLDALAGSGIEPPDLDDFTWGKMMGIAESMARSAVEDALERAIAEGDLVVGGRKWRQRQREVTAVTLNSDHPTAAGQSWRTVASTERIQHWADASRGQAPLTARLRGRVAKRLLNPIQPPDDVADVVGPLMWFLEAFGDEQPLTQAGYLSPATVRRLYGEAPWDEPYPLRAPPRSESDAAIIYNLRGWLQAAGAIRKHKNTLKRTRLGATVMGDAVGVWRLLVNNIAGDPWTRFVVETIAMLMIDSDAETPNNELFGAVSEMAEEFGWRSEVDGAQRAPGEAGVSWAFRDERPMLKVCGLLVEHGDWSDRRLALTDAGTTTMLAAIRVSAAGPRDGPR